MKKIRIIETLAKIGIKADLTGFKYIQDAMELISENEDYLFKITALYYAIARRNKVGYASAERNIRTAFSTACYKKEFQDYFFNTDDYTNGNLLGILYWRLKECETGV